VLRIWGIEATQAIQYFQSTHPLCPGPGASGIGCPDNSVPMVAERPTALRLYVSGASPAANVGAAVTSPSTSGVYGSTFSLVGTGSMGATAAPAIRGDAATTLQVALRPHAAGTYRFDIVVLEYAPNWAVPLRARPPRSRCSSPSGVGFGSAWCGSTTPAGDWMSPRPRSRTSGT
jgi:hypothetical protein